MAPRSVLAEQCQRILVRAVVHAEHDDRAHLRPQSRAGRRAARPSRPASPSSRAGPRRGRSARRAGACGMASGVVTATTSKPAARGFPVDQRAAGLPAWREPRPVPSEVEVPVVGHGRQAAHPVGQQRPEGGARLQPRVPVLGGRRSRSSRSRRDNRAPRARRRRQDRHRTAAGRPASCGCRPASWCISYAA